MNTKSRIFLAVMATIAAVPVCHADADEGFHGYFRTGGGSATKGGKEVCYRVKGANNDNQQTMGFFRLGNECDTYATLSYGAKLGEVHGVKFTAITNVAYGTQQLTNWEQSTPAWRQLFVQADHVGDGAFKDANVWLGKRFYKNPDIHILDYTWWEPALGPGVGLDMVDLGRAGKLSYAIFRTGAQDWDGQSSTSSGGALGSFRPGIVNGGVMQVQNHDIRLQQIPLWQGGQLEVGANLIFKDNNNDAKDASGNTLAKGKGGYTLTAHYTQDILGGANNVITQFAKNAGNLNGSGTPGFTGTHRGWRVIDSIVIEPQGTPITAGFVVGYQNNRNNGVTDKTFIIGGRPQYHFNDIYSVAFEGGYQSLKPGDGSAARKLVKATLAGQMSMGRSFWSRPALRAYYTYAHWNNAAKDAGGVTCTGRDCTTAVGGFESTNHGGTYGFQVEAWF